MQRRNSENKYTIAVGVAVSGLVALGVGLWMSLTGVTADTTGRVLIGIAVGTCGLLVTGGAAVAIRNLAPDLRLERAIASIDVTVEPHPVVFGEDATVEVGIVPKEPLYIETVTAAIDIYELVPTRKRGPYPIWQLERPEIHWSAASTTQFGAPVDDALEAGDPATFRFEFETPESFAQFDSTDELSIDSDTGEYLGVEPPEWYRHCDDVRCRIRVLLEANDGTECSEVQQIDGDFTRLVELLES